MQKIREKCLENFVRPSKKTDNEKPTVPQFNNDQLRPETNITKEEYERFWTPIWGMHRNSSMEAPG